GKIVTQGNIPECNIFYFAEPVVIDHPVTPGIFEVMVKAGMGRFYVSLVKGFLVCHSSDIHGRSVGSCYHLSGSEYPFRNDTVIELLPLCVSVLGCPA